MGSKVEAAKFAVDHEKTKRCLDSCKTTEQLTVMSRMIANLSNKYKAAAKASPFHRGVMELAKAWEKKRTKLECEVLNPK